MIYDLEVSPKKLERLCENWSRAEIKTALDFYFSASRDDNYYLRHVQTLIEEINVRDQTCQR